MSLRDTRIWFRQWSRMTLRIKANRSSAFRGNMGCIYCEEDIRIENQEHMEQCEGFNYEQRGLDLTEVMGKLFILNKTEDFKFYLACFIVFSSTMFLSHVKL